MRKLLVLIFGIFVVQCSGSEISIECEEGKDPECRFSTIENGTIETGGIAGVAGGVVLLGTVIGNNSSSNGGNDNSSVDEVDNSALGDATTEYHPSDFCSGWSLSNCVDAQLGAPPACQSAIFKVASGSLHVSRDAVCYKVLSSRLKGRIEFTAWALPATDSNTNFSIRLGDSNGLKDIIVISINETDRWFVGQNITPIANYSGTWTRIRIVMNTEMDLFNLYLDGTLVAEDANAPISEGIDTLGVKSGRGGEGHDSYIDDIRIDSSPF